MESLDRFAYISRVDGQVYGGGKVRVYGKNHRWGAPYRFASIEARPNEPSRQPNSPEIWVNTRELLEKTLAGEWGSNLEKGWGLRYKNGLPQHSTKDCYYKQDNKWIPFEYQINIDVYHTDTWYKIWRHIETCVFTLAKNIYNKSETITDPWSLGNNIICRFEELTKTPSYHRLLA